MKKARLDERLVALGLAESRSRAQALVLAGKVLVDDTPVTKAGHPVREGAQIRLRGEASRFVSRGGDKLAGALDDLGLDPSGAFCLDLGASTGGFSDCLLQRGARGVVAVDVGYGQLHEKLRRDPRVHVRERTNARHLEASALPEPVDLVVVDVSFISSRLLLPRIADLAPSAELLVMVKPQFEVGRGEVGKGGVVRDDEARERAAHDVAQAARERGYETRGQVDSRVTGPKGNREIFLWLSPKTADSKRESPAQPPSGH